jgi:hypothetical protein
MKIGSSDSKAKSKRTKRHPNEFAVLHVLFDESICDELDGEATLAHTSHANNHQSVDVMRHLSRRS